MTQLEPISRMMSGPEMSSSTAGICIVRKYRVFERLLQLRARLEHLQGKQGMAKIDIAVHREDTMQTSQFLPTIVSDR